MFTSLKAKFIIIAILILTAAIGISSWRTLKMQRDQLVAAAEEKVVMLTDTIERSITNAMREGRSKDVQAIVQEVGKHADIEKVSIFDSEGRIRISSEPEERGKRLTSSPLKHYMGFIEKNLPFVFEEEENGKKVHSIVKPILNRPQCYGCHDPRHKVNGFLHIDLSLAKAKAQIASIHRFVLFSAMLTVASLSFALWILLSRLVSRPVSLLMETMGRVEKGDLGARVRVKSRDELGRLGESFNDMIRRLQEAKQALEAEHQRQLEQAEKMASLGQLALAIAHEVKNPLAGVSGAMQVLAEDYSLDDPKREIIDEMLHQIRRLDKTVKDLLSYARPASPEPVPCQVSDLLERALFLIRQQVRESKVSIMTDYAEGLPPIHADPQQIQQVFLNIALNAIQAMPDGGTLAVTTRAISHQPSAISEKPSIGGNGWVEVVFSDTGHGIPPEDLKKVFQPFFTTKHRGTGLGLPICQRIVDQHGGTIHIESDVGKGTTVIVRLPVFETTLGQAVNHLPSTTSHKPYAIG